MYENGGGQVSGAPMVAPVHECNKGRGEVATLAGKSVLVSHGTVLVRDFGHDVVVDKFVEPGSEEVSRYAKVGL